MSSDTETTTPQVEKKKGGHQRGNKKSVENKKKPISKKKEKQLQRETERRNAVMAAFNKHYEEEWGSQRWPQLLEAMKKPVRHCIMINKYANVDDVKTKLKDVLSDLTMLDFIPSVPCYASKSQSRFPPPSKDSNNIMDYYILDAGSVLATEALDIQPDDQVLDICAAPGGKTLAILQRLDRKYGRLTSNEIASDRRRRLRQVIETYLPLDVMEEMSTVVGKDGTRYYGEPEQYDKVLLDAPCSSERHLLHDEKELELWTPKRTQVNAKRQLAILKAALHSVRVNGLVLYGTCSISSLENDKVIERMMRKGKIPIEPIKMKWPIGERTKYGWIILPDKTEGWGPLYFSLLRRTGVSKDGESSEEDLSDDE